MRLATAAIGGLAALTALLLLRSNTSPAQDAQTDGEAGDPLIVIYQEPRYDSPPAQAPVGRHRLLVVPLSPVTSEVPT